MKQPHPVPRYSKLITGWKACSHFSSNLKGADVWLSGQVELVDGCFLVIATTSSRQLHEEVHRLAVQRGVLCNVVDVPELCDFYYPAVVKRGALQIAISSAGKSPALAQRLRMELEAQFGAEYEDWLIELGEARRRIRASVPRPAEQKAQLHQLASAESFRQFLKRRKT